MGNSERHSNSTAADTSSEDRWLLEITSQKLRLWATITVVVIFAIHIFMGIMMDFGNIGASVTTIDQLTSPTVGLIIAGVILLLTWARACINARDTEIRNLFNEELYPWVDIYGLGFPKKSRWAYLELPDFEFVPMLAIRSADSSRVVEDIYRFRGLEGKFVPED